MLFPYPEIKLKYIVYFILLFIIGGLLTSTYVLNNKVKSLKKEQENILIANQLAQEKANLKVKSMTLQYEKLSKEREENYEKELKNLNDQYSTTKSKLNSLQQSQSEIRSSVHSSSTSRETIIKYVDRYEDVFTECTGRLVEVASEADKRRLMIINLNEEIDNIYNILKEYKQEN